MHSNYFSIVLYTATLVVLQLRIYNHFTLKIKAKQNNVLRNMTFSNYDASVRSIFKRNFTCLIACITNEIISLFLPDSSIARIFKRSVSTQVSSLVRQAIRTSVCFVIDKVQAKNINT